MGSKFDLENLIKLTEECHEVTVMWFGKDGKSLGDSNGEPTLIPELLQELEVRRAAHREMKVDEALTFLLENPGLKDVGPLADAMKMTVGDATALLVMLKYSGLIEKSKISEEN